MSPVDHRGSSGVRSELFTCERGCGILEPLLVEQRGAETRCVECGGPARLLSSLEVADRVRGRMRVLFGSEDLPTVAAKIQAVHEVQDLLRYLEATGGIEALRQPEPG